MDAVELLLGEEHRDAERLEAADGRHHAPGDERGESLVPLVEEEEARVGRNMPEPVPVILLGQLAVDTSCQGRGHGSDLLVDAARRALSAADVIGARAVVVQALDERAKTFYERFGFRQFSAREPLMLVLRTSEPRSMLQ